MRGIVIQSTNNESMPYVHKVTTPKILSTYQSTRNSLYSIRTIPPLYILDATLWNSNIYNESVYHENIENKSLEQIYGMNCKYWKKLLQSCYSYIIYYLFTWILSYISNIFYVIWENRNRANHWAWKILDKFEFIQSDTNGDESNLLKICTCKLKPKQCNIRKFELNILCNLIILCKQCNTIFSVNNLI